jgi:hypothetical protein
MNRASRFAAFALALGLSACGNEMAPAGLSYTANPAVYAAGAPIVANEPRFGGGNPDSYSIYPALPAGLTFSRTTGVISGTPTDPVAAADFVISCGNSGGSSTVLLRLGVSPAPAPVITQAPATKVVALAEPVTFNVTATGTGALTYHWHRDGVEITGQSGTSITTDPVTDLDDAAEFTVTVTDHWGSSTTSAPAKIRLEGFLAGQNLLQARQNHTAIRLAGGKVLVCGGFAVEVQGHAELFDPATGGFSDSGEMVAARQNQTANLLADGRVILIGGQGGAGGGLPLDTAEIYDPATETFTSSGPLPMSTPRYLHAATVLPSGKVLVSGGLWNTAAPSVLATAELYDPATKAFTTTGALNVARYGHTSTALPGGKVLIVGGYGLSGGALGSAELYDPATDTFTETSGAMNEARYGHTATLLNDLGLVLVAGGQAATALDAAELYDPATDTFSTTGSLLGARTFHAATALPGGKVLFTGGYQGFAILSSAELYDPVLGSFAATGDMVAKRVYHAATALESGEVLVTGGWAMSEAGLASTELFSGVP